MIRFFSKLWVSWRGVYIRIPSSMTHETWEDLGHGTARSRYTLKAEIVFWLNDENIKFDFIEPNVMKFYSTASMMFFKMKWAVG